MDSCLPVLMHHMPVAVAGKLSCVSHDARAYFDAAGNTLAERALAELGDPGSPQEFSVGVALKAAVRAGSVSVWRALSRAYSPSFQQQLEAALAASSMHHGLADVILAHACEQHNQQQPPLHVLCLMADIIMDRNVAAGRSFLEAHSVILRIQQESGLHLPSIRLISQAPDLFLGLYDDNKIYHVVMFLCNTDRAWGRLVDNATTEQLKTMWRQAEVASKAARRDRKSRGVRGLLDMFEHKQELVHKRITALLCKAQQRGVQI